MLNVPIWILYGTSSVGVSSVFFFTAKIKQSVYNTGFTSKKHNDSFYIKRINYD